MGFHDNAVGLTCDIMSLVSRGSDCSSIASTGTGEITMSQSTEFYRVTLSNGQVIELQREDIDILKKALEVEDQSAEVTLPGQGENKMTIYTEHVVSIEASGLVRRGLGFIEVNKGKK